MIALLAAISTAEAQDGWSKAREPIAGRVEYAPYWDPIGSLSVFRANGRSYVGLNLGLELGLSLNDLESILAGKSRVRGTYLLGGGYDVRMGTFVGPVTEYWSLLGGVDAFYNAYPIVGLAASPGVDFPLVATIGPPQIYGLAGVTTTWVLEPSRRVDWDRTLYRGFGHEFEYRAGFMVNTGRFHLGIAWTRRILASGPNDGFGLTIGF